MNVHLVCIKSFVRTIGFSDERRRRIVVQVKFNATREYLRSPRASGLRQTGHALAVAPWGWWPCVFRRTLRFSYRRRCPTVERTGGKMLSESEFNEKFIKLFPGTKVSLTNCLLNLNLGLLNWWSAGLINFQMCLNPWKSAYRVRLINFSIAI